MTMISKQFSLNFVSPYLVYDYVDDNRAMGNIDVLVILFSPSMNILKITEKSISL